MEWYDQLGFTTNPFSPEVLLKPAAFWHHDDIVNEAVYYVESGSLVLVDGPKESGKTALLKSIIQSFKGKRRIAYLNAGALGSAVDIEEALRNANGWKGRLFGRRPQGMILLLDDVHELSFTNTEKLKYYFDQGYIHAAVLTTPSIDSLQVDPSFLDRASGRILNLKQPNANQRLALLQECLKQHPLSKETAFLKEIASRDTLPSQTLSNAELIFKRLPSGHTPSKKLVHELLGDES